MSLLEATDRAPVASHAGWAWSRRPALISLGLITVVSVVVAIGLGPVGVAPPTVLKIIGHHMMGLFDGESWARTDDAIIWQVRLPRVLLGAIVGSTLGVVGVTLQALVRNPLAEPYILGVSSGASAGAAAAILFGVGSWLGRESVSLMAFFGALGALALVLALAPFLGSHHPLHGCS